MNLLKFPLQGFAALLIAAAFSCPASSEEVGREVPDIKVKLNELTVEVGIQTPFQAIHLTDSHINKIDKRNFGKLAKRFEKQTSKNNAIYREMYLMDAVHYAESHNDMMVLHTGDFLDMYSEAGLDYAACIFKRLKNCIACVGNHEFLNVVGHGVPTDEVRGELYETVQSAYPNDIIFASRIYNGVNFVAFDNVNYNISKEIFKKMKAEVKKGYPIVILCHIPLYIPEYIQHRLDQRGGAAKGAAASVMGAPAEITDKFAGDDEKKSGARYEQRATDLTIEFTEWLRTQDCVKAILCGHNHRVHAERFSPSCIQYTMPASYAGNIDLITFK